MKYVLREKDEIMDIQKAFISFLMQDRKFLEQG